MNPQLLHEIGRSQRLKIIQLLKRSQGLCVRDLAAQLEMSYMGVKQHCVALHGEGYLDTWRQPSTGGRPELLYRLTRKTHDLYSIAADPLVLDLLEEVQELYGAAAPEKILYKLFLHRTEVYRSQLRGETIFARAMRLAHIREAEGCISAVVEEPSLMIEEHHSPLLELMERYPIVQRLETEMISVLLGATVRREQEILSGLYRCRFHIEAEEGSVSDFPTRMD